MDALLTIEADADITIQNGDILTTGGLANSIWISLFSPDFWGNAILPSGDRLGSTLPELINRELTNRVRVDIEKASSRALAWMVTQGLVATITPTATIINQETVVLSIVTTQPVTETVYRINWTQQRAEL